MPSLISDSLPLNISISKLSTMETLATHPSNAKQAAVFTSPTSLSFPGGATAMNTPVQQQSNGADTSNSTASGVTTVIPTNLPDAAVQGVSGIVPTLQ